MKEPKLEDYNLNKEILEFSKKFENILMNRKKWCVFVLSIILYSAYGFLFWLVSAYNQNNQDDWSISLCVLLVILWMAPWLLADWLGERINLYFLSSSDDYSLYKKTQENKKIYDAQLKEYNKYLEEIKKANARNIINENLVYLPELKQKIFNKRITDDDLVEFRGTIEKLGNCRKYMSWDEMNHYEEFEKYLNLREQRISDVYKANNGGNYRKKDQGEDGFESVTNIGNNTEKIKIDESKYRDEENTEEHENNQRAFEGKNVDFEEINKENISLGLKGEKTIINYEKEILIRNKRGDLADKVKHVSAEDGAGTGYDILSFDLDDNPKYIEVKTTKGNRNIPFYFSENEMAFIEHEPKYCCIYRLYNFNVETETGNLIIANGYEEIMQKFSLKTSQYKVKIK